MWAKPRCQPCTTVGGRGSTCQWVSNVAAQWNHLGSFTECCNLVPPHRFRLYWSGVQPGHQSFWSCPGGSIGQPRLKSTRLGRLAFIVGSFIHWRELGLIWTSFLHSTIDFLTLLICSSANAVFSSFNYEISLSLYYWEYLARFLKQQLNLSACHFVFIIHDSNLSNSLWDHIKWLVLNKQTNPQSQHLSQGV